MQLYAEAAPAFKEVMQQGITPRLLATLLTDQPPDKLQEGLFGYFAEFAVKRYQNNEIFKAYRCAQARRWSLRTASQRSPTLCSA